MLKRAHWFGVGGIALIAPLAAFLHAGCESTCQQPSDCPSGTFCFIGPTDCATPVPLGFCTDISAICTKASSPVCGCNNETFANACIASEHGQAIATMAACLPGPCESSSDCSPDEACVFLTVGVCDNQGIAGLCVPRPTSCEDAIPSPVCGCHDKTFPSTCEMLKAGQSEFALGGCPCQDSTSCGKGEFCNFSPSGGLAGSSCLASSPTGQCTVMPTSCSPVQAPVCGCDGNTYPNACVASMMGVNVAIATGGCTPADLPDGG